MAEARKILLVEDDPGFGSLLQEVLQVAGHRVQLVSTGAGALAAVEGDRPDVLCVDIDLPDGTGWDVLDQLESRAAAPPTVVVITAGMGASRSRHRPGTYLLLKPFPIDSLLRLVSGEELPEI